MTSRHGPGARSVERLGRLVAAPGVLLLPTVHDPLSAWLCEMAGFEAVLVSRSVIAMSVLASEEPATVEDEVVVGRAAEICRVVSVPVVVDLTPATGPHRIRHTVVALAMSGVAGVVVDDMASDGDGVLPVDIVRERLVAVRDGLDRRGLDLVVVARTFAAARGGLTPQAALDQLSALQALWQLGVVDGLESAHLLRRRRAGAGGSPHLMAVDRDRGDAAVHRAQRAGFRAYTWSTPLLGGAISGMQCMLAGLDDAEPAGPPASIGDQIPMGGG